jgi:tRNA(Ile)-lysidine synthase TilS/MesJ
MLEVKKMELNINSIEHCEIIQTNEEVLDLLEIERSIIKKYRSKLWGPFVKGVQEYEMIKENDKIAVAISGGKDSLLLAKLMQELQKHGRVKFELEFIAMDPGFHQINRDTLQKNCDHLGIPVKIFNTNVFEVAEQKAGDYPCYMCARMRRGALYNMAETLGCNKMALGHHFNDVIETTMLNVLYAGNFKTMLPKLKSTNFENMELLRPMYNIREKDILTWVKNTGLNPMNCGCTVAAGRTSSKRKEIKELISEYKKIFDDVDKSIFNAGKNVNLEAIVGWQKDGEKVSYLDVYDEE